MPDKKAVRLNDGDYLYVKGKKYQIVDGEPKIVSIGPLGGEQKKVEELKIGDVFYVGAVYVGPGIVNDIHEAQTIESGNLMSIFGKALVETNVPNPRLRKNDEIVPLKITAAQAGDMVDILGRYIAVRVDGARFSKNYDYTVCINASSNEFQHKVWLHRSMEDIWLMPPDFGKKRVLQVSNVDNKKEPE